MGTVRSPQTGCSAAWLAHLLWEQGVESSNLSIPTIAVYDCVPGWVRLCRRSRVLTVLTHQR